MSGESRTEETKPVASGLDLRLRLLHRLADPDRNTTWAYLILAGVMLIGLAFTLYLALTRWEWQIFSLAGIYGVVMVVSLSGFWLVKRGSPRASVWMVLIILQVAIAISPLFVSGLGLWYAIGILLGTLSITSLCMRPQRTALANLLGIVAGLTALVIDGFLTQLQTAPGQILEILVITGVAILAVIYLLILIGYFPTYSLRAKITITVFSAAILSIGALSIVNSISTQQALINAVNQTLTLAARETGKDIDGYFRGLAERVGNQADTPTWSIYLALPPEQQATNTTTQTFLVTQKLLTGALYYALLDRDGNVILHTTDDDTALIEPYLGLSGSVRGSLLQTMSSGAVYISSLIFPSAGEVPYFLVAAQIRNYADEPVGILVAAFLLDTVQELIRAGNDTAGTGSYAVLLDENHLRIAHGTDPSTQYRLLVPPTPRVYEELVSSMRLPVVDFEEVATNYPDFNDGLSNLVESAYFSSEDSATPGEVNSVVAIRLGSRPWVLVFLQPQSVILAPVAAQTRTNILLAVVVSGLTLLAAALLARLVADPIVRLTSIAERAAGGNLYLQASAQSPDEIGTLGTAFNSMINQLRNTLEGLEARIAERTAELTQTSEQMEYRANRLQMVTEVAHAIAAVQDPEELLPRVTTEISTRYSYYHVGVFLIDTEKMYAVLHASNSEGGQRMLARHHRLRIGEVGIVGFVAGTGEARIALDVGKDAVFFDNPDLPETRSEIALPLKVGPEVIGVLDVQSTEPGAFSQDDSALLSALADQVATAIQNTRLYDEMRRTLRELQVVQQQYVQDAWSKLIAERASNGFEYSFGRIKPISESDPGAEVQGIENLAAPMVSSDGSGTLIVPIGLRGQVIGVLDLQEADPGREWSQDDLELARAVADQVGLALENARLLAETQRRAERERLVADITTKMRAINEPQAILETAAAELRNALRVKSVQVRLQTVESPQSKYPRSESGPSDVTLEQGGEK
jgi:GAF domain-containing protein/HAMP domain-containing protein